MRIDLELAIAALPPREQQVCRGLAQGRSITEMATDLACGRDTIDRSIRRIKKAFTDLGLQAWVQAN